MHHLSPISHGNRAAGAGTEDKGADLCLVLVPPWAGRPSNTDLLQSCPTACPSPFFIVKLQCQYRIKVEWIENRGLDMSSYRVSIISTSSPPSQPPLSSLPFLVSLLVHSPSCSSEGHSQLPGPSTPCHRLADGRCSELSLLWWRLSPGWLGRRPREPCPHLTFPVLRLHAPIPLILHHNLPLPVAWIAPLPEA